MSGVYGSVESLTQTLPRDGIIRYWSVSGADREEASIPRGLAIDQKIEAWYLSVPTCPGTYT